MSKETEAPRQHATAQMQQHKTHAARLSIVSNSVLVALKLGVGLWTGSVSVLSEALHSATDLLASGIAYFSVRFSDQPPDEEHPYGHGKIESLSGMAEALLIFVAAAFIIYEAIEKLRAPGDHSLMPDAGMAIMAVSVVVNIGMSRYLFRVAYATDSQALLADAEHLRADVLTSLGVFVGLGLVRVTGQTYFDPITALLISVVILHAAFRLTRNSYHLLLDRRLPPEEEARIRALLEADTRVLGYHKLRTRKSGPYRHADVHVQIDDSHTLVEAHAISEELEDHIRATLPSIEVNIHIEPYHAEMRHQQEAHGASPRRGAQPATQPTDMVE
ncbi:MAG: cation diffusion facilitator family transporter [Chloroherpetonaceae bacterium]|nr:cation diffusion facilitator family transporter [Chthonomonadaceae bacterium]MDW8207788.1 cation diffusion facilitator family transporter [Chloroherpetonaceae bacterium]